MVRLRVSWGGFDTLYGHCPWRSHSKYVHHILSRRPPTILPWTMEPKKSPRTCAPIRSNHQRRASSPPLSLSFHLDSTHHLFFFGRGWCRSLLLRHVLGNLLRLCEIIFRDPSKGFFPHHIFQHRYLDLVLAQWFRCFVELLVYVAICTLIFKLLVKCVCVVLASMRKPLQILSGKPHSERMRITSVVYLVKWLQCKSILCLKFQGLLLHLEMFRKEPTRNKY